MYHVSYNSSYTQETRSATLGFNTIYAFERIRWEGKLVLFLFKQPFFVQVDIPEDAWTELFTHQMMIIHVNFSALQEDRVLGETYQIGLYTDAEGFESVRDVSSGLILCVV